MSCSNCGNNQLYLALYMDGEEYELGFFTRNGKTKAPTLKQLEDAVRIMRLVESK